MKEYIHTVQYYETDKMGITHHSNYIRWMEEARIDYLTQLGLGYDKMEERGIYSPVTKVECKYVTPTTFPEVISITVSIEEFKGFRLSLGYVMKNQSKKTVCEGHSEHCFLDSNGKIVRLSKDYPDIYETLTKDQQPAS